ncbi:ATP-binding cassette domain-containing protein [Butyrivibrio sp. X503]|uniref:ATP-binding cassette domain-containing protein n=1 Tax=Butyrivibrio sp. X503 TaxID=2364878 RepID=UPI000EA875FC|nr:ATP-binding cassette domain-containing protein [Butyrivibrio sp. X503]RKM58223.1 ATP-binding cassette domain-containing protein [Butyrivibrio sp. X503]
MFDLINMTKKYKNKIIFEDETVSVGNHKIIFFMGPNGCGKTTLIKCLSGLEKYKGKIKYDNYSIDDIRKETFVIWDDCPFYDDLSGINNLYVLSESTSIKADDIKRISNKYFSEDTLKRKVKKYSYGQRKMLALVLGEILNPSLLIMDEISNGLDYDTMKLLRKEIKEKSVDKDIILTGHQFAFYEGLVDEVFIIHNKHIIDVTDEYISCDDLGLVYERYFDE